MAWGSAWLFVEAGYAAFGGPLRLRLPRKLGYKGFKNITPHHNEQPEKS